MFLVVEKMGAVAVDEDDEVLLVFCRLGGGEVAALLVPVVSVSLFVDILSVSLAKILMSLTTAHPKCQNGDPFDHRPLGH